MHCMLIICRIAGSDTTGTSAAFTVLQLVNNPEKLQNLKKEIDTAFSSKDDIISFANTQDLPYLNAVINETLRVMPIVVSGRFMRRFIDGR
jgi:cytochrome P450